MKPLSTLGYRHELDGLRAVAVTAVVVEHAFDTKTLWAKGGHIGVELFFVLSGFLITTLLMEEHARTGMLRMTAFYKRRLRRLAPAFVVTLLASTVISVWWPWPHAWPGLESALAAILYGGNYVAAANPDALGYLGHTWSLAVEEQFYVLFPWALLAALKRAVPPLTIAQNCLAGAFLCTLIRVFERVNFPETVPYFRSEARLGGILVGAALAAWRLSSTWPKGGRSTRLGGWAGVLACALAYQIGDGGTTEAAAVSLPVVDIATVLILVAVITTPRSPLAHILRFAPLGWLGQRSYALYLYHFPIARLVNARWPAAGAGPRIALCILVPIALAALSAPLERRFRRHPVGVEVEVEVKVEVPQPRTEAGSAIPEPSPGSAEQSAGAPGS